VFVTDPMVQIVHPAPVRVTVEMEKTETKGTQPKE